MWNIQITIELLTRRPTTSLHVRWCHSENWFFWSYKKWRVTCSQCRSVYSDDSERHLRESNITETNIGIICSVYFVELDHEMLNWDNGWDSRNMLIYVEFNSSNRIFPRHYFSSNHWELQYCSNYECLSCFQNWLNSIIDSSSSTLLSVWSTTLKLLCINVIWVSCPAVMQLFW